MMNTVNLIDGMDGLVTGVVAITGIFITIISFTLKQYSIAMLSAIFTGAVIGFLPHNWNPAKIFMGDTGLQFLGLALAVLSIMGGAKLAMALNLSRLYKLIGIGLVGGAMIALIAWIDYRQHQRGVHLKLDNGPLPPGGPAGALVPDDNSAAKGQNDDKRTPSKPEHETVR